MALTLLQLPSSPHHHNLSALFPTSSYCSSSSFQSLNSRDRPGGILPLILHGKPSSFTTPSSISAAPAVEDSIESAAEPRRRLIAQNIPWTCTAEDIRSLFEKYGTVVDVELSMYNSKRNRGLVFITMSSVEEALAALNNLNSYDLDGRAIKVEFARSSKKISPSPPAAPTSNYNVFVGNLSWRVRSRDLRELFNGTGNVLSAEVIFQSNPRRSAGYGFVSFALKQEAETAIAALNGKRFMGRPVHLVLGNNQADNAEAKAYVSEQLDETSSGVDENLEQSEDIQV